MTVVVRRFSASPKRTATQVWSVITELVCHSDDKAKREFHSVVGGMSSIISDTIPESSPIVIRGKGPLLRIYCLYDDEAVSGDDKQENSISWNLFADDWTAFIPCRKNELEIMKKFFSKRSENFEVYDESKTLSFQKSEKSISKADFSFDLDTLRDL